MSKNPATRISGLRPDPAIASLLRTSVENRAALSARQKLDRTRTKATYDLDPVLQEACTALAKEWDTSTSQAVALCLAYALDAYSRKEPALLTALDKRERTRTPRFSWNLVIPEKWQEAVYTWAGKKLPPGWRK